MKAMLAIVAAMVLLCGCTQEQELQQIANKIPSVNPQPITGGQLPAIPQLPSQSPAPIPSISPNEECSLACKAMLSSGADLSSGPCLLNPIPRNPDWVCDIAHKPRLLIDDLRENECSSYLSQSAHHFVEVAPDCSFIRSA